MNRNIWSQLSAVRLGVALLALVLVLAVACGAPAAPEEPAAPAPPPVTEATPTPAAPAEPAPAPPAAEVERPSGTLNAGLRELGTFVAHPRLAVNPAILVTSGVGITESLVMHDKTGRLQPMLTDWSVSDDFLVWTFTLQEGIQFHQGYGQLTAEALVWSINELAASDTHPAASLIRDIWQNPDGWVETPDDRTIQLHTGVPFPDVSMFHRARTPFNSIWAISPQQVEELGAEEANRRAASTGPWEYVESRTSEFWRLQAVEDHWRQTPYFAELVLWEIPEESSRLAGFQTGQLDTFDMGFDNIPLVEQVSGAEFVRAQNTAASALLFYGGWYRNLGTPDQRAGYDPALPWVSADPDPASPEWLQAALVRQAMALAIDREALVETLLRGFGSPLEVLVDYMDNAQHLIEDDLPRWGYEPDRARELLAEAGHADGFRINLTTAVRGGPMEIEACEAIATMWGNELGLDVNFQRIPYETLRPSLVGRTYQGATCHSSAVALAPSGGFSNFHSTGVFNRGIEHPLMEDKLIQAQQAYDPAERERLEQEVMRFMQEHALTRIGLYTNDTIWPVGPNIQDWSEHVKLGDTRTINGYEFIQRRQ